MALSPINNAFPTVSSEVKEVPVPLTVALPLLILIVPVPTVAPAPPVVTAIDGLEV